MLSKAGWMHKSNAWLTAFSLQDLWKTRRKPESIKQLTGVETRASLEALEMLGDTKFAAGATASNILGYKDSHKTWDLLQNIQVASQQLSNYKPLQRSSWLS